MRKDFGAKMYLYPQPVMIIATYNEDGTENAMITSWGGIAGNDEIIIDLGSHRTTLLPMLMYGKEASNRKQEIDRQHYTIPNQRPKDKHCGKI